MDWSFWDVLWTSFIFFLWITFIVIFFNVVVDVFRSRDLSGLGKAGWLLVLVILPFLGLLIYVLMRGEGMANRGVQDQLDRADRLRESMGVQGEDPAGQIARGKELMDAGVIDAAEFEQIKRRALAV